MYPRARRTMACHLRRSFKQKKNRVVKAEIVAAISELIDFIASSFGKKRLRKTSLFNVYIQGATFCIKLPEKLEISKRRNVRLSLVLPGLRESHVRRTAVRGNLLDRASTRATLQRQPCNDGPTSRSLFFLPTPEVSRNADFQGHNTGGLSVQNPNKCSEPIFKLN